MQYVRLGNTGLKVSRLCLGCMSYGVPNERWPWALDETASRSFIQRALELGINFFDVVTSPIVGATKMPHLEEAVAALQVELSAAEIASLEELYQPRAVAGHR